MKRSLFVFMIIPILLSPAFAEGKQESKEGPVVLTGMVRDYTLRQEAPWTSAIKVFQEKHPNVTIKLEGLPYDDQRVKVLTTVAAGKGPDIVQTDCIWLGEFASSKILIDLSDRLAADAALRDDYLPVFFEASKWQGKVYGLWLNSDVRMLGYHKDLFVKAGLDPNKPPATWKELREYAKKLTNPAEGVWGYGFNAFSTDHTADRWSRFRYMKGGSVLTSDYTKAAFNGPAGVEALQLLVDLMNTDKASPPDLLGAKESDLPKAFVAKKYAMMIPGWGTFGPISNGRDTPWMLIRPKWGWRPFPFPTGGNPPPDRGAGFSVLPGTRKIPILPTISSSWW